MKKASIDPVKCDKSPLCPAKRSCPVQAITQEKKGLFGFEASKVDPEKCIGCGKCLKNCPGRAITLA